MFFVQHAAIIKRYTVICKNVEYLEQTRTYQTGVIKIDGSRIDQCVMAAIFPKSSVGVEKAASNDDIGFFTAATALIKTLRVTVSLKRSQK